MEALYVFKDSYLRKKSSALYIEPKSEDQKPIYVPLKNISSIMVFSEIEMNKKTLELFSYSQVPVFFFNYNGEYIGCFYPVEENKTGEMLLLQLQHYQDLEKRIIIAREILYGVADNILKILKSYKNDFPEINEKIEMIEKLKKNLPSARRNSFIDGYRRQYTQELLRSTWCYILEKRFHIPRKNSKTSSGRNKCDD